MPQQPAPRFDVGDLVRYIGSKWRCHGFKSVTHVEVINGQPRYQLRDDVWNYTLRRVRETSLIGPND